MVCGHTEGCGSLTGPTQYRSECCCSKSEDAVDRACLRRTRFVVQPATCLTARHGRAWRKLGSQDCPRRPRQQPFDVPKERTKQPSVLISKGVKGFHGVAGLILQISIEGRCGGMLQLALCSWQFPNAEERNRTLQEMLGTETAPSSRGNRNPPEPALLPSSDFLRSFWHPSALAEALQQSAAPWLLSDSALRRFSGPTEIPWNSPRRDLSPTAELLRSWRSLYCGCFDIF